MSKCQMCGFPTTTGGCSNATCLTNHIALNPPVITITPVCGFGHERDLATLRARVARLREALEKYADGDNHEVATRALEADHD